VAIIDRLSRAVDSAVVAKCSLYWSMVAKKVTIKIKSRYQKFIAVSVEVFIRVSLSHPHAKSLVIGYGNRVIMIENAIRNSINLINTSIANTPLCLDAINDGIKACVKAPSANIRRNRFGSLNATKNISLQIDAPSAEAIKTSLKRPVTLENSIPKLFVNIDFNLIMLFYLVK
jgi:hypothetical protein